MSSTVKLRIPAFPYMDQYFNLTRTRDPIHTLSSDFENLNHRYETGKARPKTIGV